MAKVLIGNSVTQPAQNGTAFIAPTYGTTPSYKNTESLHQIEMPAGTIRHFSWYQLWTSSAGAVTKVAMRVNGAETALAITAPPGTLGRFEDMTSEVAIAEGDLLTVGQTGSYAPYDATINYTAVEFETAGDHAEVIYGSAELGWTGPVASTTGANYVQFGCHRNPSSVEADTVMQLRAPGTLSRLRVIVNYNTKVGVTYVHLRKNNADSGVFVAVPAATTGVFLDATNSVTVTTGDTINIRYDGNGQTGDFQFASAAVRFIGSGKKWDCWARGDSGGGNYGNKISYIPLFGWGNWNPGNTEDSYAVRVPFNTIATNLRVQVDYGIAGGIPVTFKLRINGQDGDMAVTPPLNTRGWFEDVTNYDQLHAGDVVAIRGTAGGYSLTAIIRYTMVTLQEGLIINQSLRPGVGEVTVNGQTAVLQSDASPEPGAGALVLTGPQPYAASVFRTYPSTGHVSASGGAPDVHHSGSAVAGIGGLTVIGYWPIVNATVVSQQAVMAMGVEIPPTRSSSQAVMSMGQVIPDVKASFESTLALGEIIPAVSVSAQTLLVLAEGERCTSMRCQLWRITRRDGETLCFTSLDVDYPLGDEIYEACHSLNPSAAEQQSILGSTGNIELQGVLSSDRITEADLYGGLYDDCFVEVWLANFDPKIHEPPRRIAGGWAGSLSHGETGFTMEVLGPGTRLDQQSLVQTVSPGCRWNFGDGRCQYDREGAKLTATVTKRGTRLTFVAAINGTDGGKQWANGLCRWKTGVNTGQACEVKLVDFTTGAITLWALPSYVPQVGETFELLPGCDRSADTCKNLYGQLINFGGFPDVPGTDAITQAPDAKV